MIPQLRPLIQRYLHLIPPDGIILDLGCGEGQDALLLTQQGFSVEAVDTAICLEVLKQRAEKEHISTLITHATDIRTFPFIQKYGTIICMNVLHFLKNEEIVFVLKKMKEATQSGGLHFLSVFTQQGDLHSDKMYFFKHDELRDHYQDWKIYMYSEAMRPTKEKNTEGKQKQHEVAFLVAQKP